MKKVVVVVVMAVPTVTVINLKQELEESKKHQEQLTQEQEELRESHNQLREDHKVLKLKHLQLTKDYEELEIHEGRLQEELDTLKQRVEEFEIFEFEATGYAPYDNKSGICNDGDPSTTATGTKPRHGVVAVNPKVIPYGTKFYVQGYGWVTAEDTGGAIRRREDLIDLFFDTHDEAYAWGRRKIKVVARKGEINRGN